MRNSSYLFKPQFNHKGLDTVLTQLFTNARISDCIRPILITTYNVESNKPYYFSTRKARAKANLNFKLVDVCRATSAGPTYLPAKMLWEPERMICVDGGVFQNNPTTSALVEIMKYPELYTGDKVLPLEEIYIKLSCKLSGHEGHNEPQRTLIAAILFVVSLCAFVVSLCSL